MATDRSVQTKSLKTQEELRSLLATAIRIGERQAMDAVASREAARHLRNTICRALILLRAGRVGYAMVVLEQAIKEMGEQ